MTVKVQPTAVQAEYCRDRCDQRVQTGGVECGIGCPLLKPHLTRGEDGRLEFRANGQVHLMDAADVPRLLRDHLLVHFFQEGPAVRKKGELTAVPQKDRTGNAFCRREADAILLYIYELGTWIVPADWVEQVARRAAPIAPCAPYTPGDE